MPVVEHAEIMLVAVTPVGESFFALRVRAAERL